MIYTKVYIKSIYKEKHISEKNKIVALAARKAVQTKPMGAPASNCSAEERDIETNGDLNINEL